MLQQDASRFAWLPVDDRQYDLAVTRDDLTSAVYSGFLVAEEGTASSFRALSRAGCEVCAKSRTGRAANTAARKHKMILAEHCTRRRCNRAGAPNGSHLRGRRLAMSDPPQ
jgi:hypothetical protein